MTGQQADMFSQYRMPPARLACALAAWLDGPHTNRDTAAAAGLASEAIRFLNYATGPHARTGLTQPATAYRITGSLAEAAARLPQLFGHLTGWLDAECAAGRLGDDHGGPVTVLTDRARHHIEQAARHADALSDALNDAQSALATVHGTPKGAGS